MNPTGYGIFYYAGLNKNGMSSGYILAHRYSFYVANGYLPFEPDSCIMHACDNRACVNPGHLSEGTLRDNIEDMIRKGRNYSKKRLPVQ